MTALLVDPRRDGGPGFAGEPDPHARPVVPPGYATIGVFPGGFEVELGDEDWRDLDRSARMVLKAFPDAKPVTTGRPGTTTDYDLKRMAKERVDAAIEGAGL